VNTVSRRGDCSMFKWYLAARSSYQPLINTAVTVTDLIAADLDTLLRCSDLAPDWC